MMNFEKLKVYQDAIILAIDIYKLTSKFPKEEVFGIVSQLRRAAVSISLNIAEGSGRGPKEFSHFLIMARGSCHELIPLLKISLELNYLHLSDYQQFYERIDNLTRRIKRGISS